MKKIALFAVTFMLGAGVAAAASGTHMDLIRCGAWNASMPAASLASLAAAGSTSGIFYASTQNYGWALNITPKSKQPGGILNNNTIAALSDGSEGMLTRDKRKSGKLASR